MTFTITKSSILCYAALAIGSQAMALDGVITAGAGAITNPNPNLTLVTTTSDKAVVHWATGIDTTPIQTLQFAEKNSNSMVLNIVGGGRTNFQGNLIANGKVWIINPDGMLFNGATIDVGSLLLSTSNVTNPEGAGFFNNNSGHYVFDQKGNYAPIIIDHTIINAAGDGTHNGDIIVMAPAVAIQNGSHVKTVTGDVMLEAGEEFALNFDGDGLISYGANNAIIQAVSQPVAGVDNSMYVGTGSTIDTKPNPPGVFVDPAALVDSRVFIGADLYKEAVLDHIININGQHYDTPPEKSTGPKEGAQINPGFLLAVAPVTPKPPAVITPTPPAAVLPTQTANVIIPPLTRPLKSIGDETVHDTVVDPNVANVTYARPYLVSLANSVEEGNLTLAAPNAAANAAAANPVNLANLSPAAGGSPESLANLSPSAGGDAQALADLSPSAGGTTANTTSCANSFLDSAWLSDPGLNKCAQ